MESKSFFVFSVRIMNGDISIFLKGNYQAFRDCRISRMNLK